MPPLLILLGPTASGKEAAAFHAAGDLNAEIVTCDSVKPYRGLAIAAAAPPPDRARQVLHHLVGVIEPTERLHAAKWLELAEGAFARAASRGRRPLVVGGTALYLKALLHGLFEGPARDDTLRERWRNAEETSPGILHARVADVDPPAAGRIHPNDTKRLLRAVEVFETTGERISDLQQEWAGAPTRSVTVVGLRRTREDLRDRISRRIHRMVDAGLVEEVRELHEAGALGPTAAEAIGVKEVIPLLGDPATRPTLPDVVEQIRAHTWGLARRQMTWFKRFPVDSWLDVDAAEPPQVTGGRVARTFLTDLARGLR